MLEGKFDQASLLKKVSFHTSILTLYFNAFKVLTTAYRKGNLLRVFRFCIDYRLYQRFS